MAGQREGRVGKEVVLHHFAADKRFQRQRGQHVQAEAEAGDIDHGVVCREIVQHVAGRAIAEREEAGHAH